MADYINKNEVLNLIMHNDKVCHYADERYENVVYKTAQTICKVVADMPAADVQPVKHGKWIWDSKSEFGNPYGSYACSECESKQAYRENYCPDCGAKMDGDSK